MKTIVASWKTLTGNGVLIASIVTVCVQCVVTDDETETNGGTGAAATTGGVPADAGAGGATPATGGETQGGEAGSAGEPVATGGQGGEPGVDGGRGGMAGGAACLMVGGGGASCVSREGVPKAGDPCEVEGLEVCNQPPGTGDTPPRQLSRCVDGSWTIVDENSDCRATNCYCHKWSLFQGACCLGDGEYYCEVASRHGTRRAVCDGERIHMLPDGPSIGGAGGQGHI